MPTDADHATTADTARNVTSESGSDLQVTSQGKNLLIEVPDYDAKLEGNQVTYLRLGMMVADDLDTKASRGGDLVATVNQVGPGDGWDDAPRVFEDDWRERGKAEGHALSQDQRKERSEALMTPGKPGGWRDHTDGDRISTTRGDKLEVIGGNYKLVVLGRNGVDNAGQASGLDFSGGHFQDFDAAPGTVNEIRWVQDEGGTWKIFEKTEHGIVHAVYQGDVTEEYYGNKLISTVGSAAGAAIPPDARASMAVGSHGNPEISDMVWAKSITENVTVSGNIKSETKAIQVTDVLTAVNITETVTSAAHEIFDNSAVVFEETAGFRSTNNIGGTLEFNLGPKRSFNMGPTAEYDFSMKEGFTLQETETSISKMETTIKEQSAAISKMETALKQDVSALSQTVSTLKTSQTSLNQTVTALKKSDVALQNEIKALNIMIGL